MHTVVRHLAPLLAALLSILHCSANSWAINDRDEILVGRIAHTEGDLMRYVPETKDWSLTVADAPFGLEDTLYAGDNAKAELILPNETWMRIGEDTQVQMIDLNGDATTVDVASGLARLYNRSRDVVIKATTPFGYVVAPAGSAFDLYVGDESLEVIAVRGDVDFVHEASGTRYPVRQGGNSVIADRQTTTTGNGSVDGPWDDWNNQRESLWAQRQQRRTSSANLLPAPIREDAYALEESGRWERVYYNGDYRDMWRPTRVDTGWRPFTNGRWVDYYGDNCWIPSESFGYVTHHYGSWVYVDAFHSWYWMPPAPRRPAYNSPTLVISFGWYPGRVGWFHHGRDIGWVPLAPNEDYYGYRHWGHRTRVIRDHAPRIDLGRYHYLNHASIIDRDHLYRGDRYPRDIRRDVNKTVIINQYKPVTQWNDFRQDKRRFDFSDRHVERKPHVETVERIRDNERRRKEIDRLDRGRIERDLQQVKVRRDMPTQTDIRPPKNTSKIVDADKRTSPLDRGTLPAREFKPRERERAVSAENRHGFDAGSAAERRPEGSDRFKRRTPQEQEPQQRLRSPRDRQVEESGNRNFGEKQQERQRGPRDPQELRRSREEQRSGDGQRPTFSREQDRQRGEQREVSGKSGEEQLRPQRPNKAEGDEASSDRLGAGRPDRFNRPGGEEQRDVQQGRETGERQRREHPELQNQSQEEQRSPRQFDRRQREQQEQQQADQAEQRRRQGDERLQQQREQAQQQEMQQRRQEEGLRRQQEQDRKSQAEARQQEQQRDRQQQLRQQREQQDQQQELQRRQQREADERRQQEALRNRQAEDRQQEQQRERQQQMRRQQEEQQREQQQQIRRQQEQQQQEMQRRQQQEEQQRERQQQMRRQQEEQQRERQQQMRRQQEEQQRERQQQMRRQQEEQKREQQQQMRRQQEEQQRERQQQQQEQQRKKRPLTPEEQQQLNQSN